MRKLRRTSLRPPRQAGRKKSRKDKEVAGPGDGTEKERWQSVKYDKTWGDRQAPTPPILKRHFPQAMGTFH